MTEETTERQERTFAGYHLLNRVHLSERAELYRARQPTLAAGKRFLVKRFRSKDSAFGQALAQRCSRLRSLGHPLIPAVLDSGVAHGYPYLARSYTRGITLARLTRQLAQHGLTLPIEQLLGVLLQVLDAVEVSHVASTSDGVPALTHGDLSGSHILMRLDGTPLILGLETPRGLEPSLPVALQQDISVPSALLYGHLVHTGPSSADDDEELKSSRERLIEAALPIVRRGLGLDPLRVYGSVRELANALRGCLDYAGLGTRPVDLVPTLEALVESTGSTEHSALRPVPARRTTSAPLSPAIDVGLPEGTPLTRPPLDEISALHAAPVPAPIDFGEVTAPAAPAAPSPSPPASIPPRTFLLPALEVKDGNEALAEETARAITESFADILDPFDDVSAEYDFSDASNPFGFEPRVASAVRRAVQGSGSQRLGNVLEGLGYVSYQDVRRALERQGRGVRLGEALVQQGVINEAQLVHALGVLHDVPVLTDAQVAALTPQPAALARLPAAFVATRRVVPLGLDSAEVRAEVLLVDPTDHEAQVEARVLLGVQDLICSLATRDAVDALIARLYPPERNTEVSAARATILLVDPDDARRRACANRLRSERFVVEDVISTARARRILDAALPTALIVCASDIEDGLALLAEFRARGSAVDAYAALAGDVARIPAERAVAAGVDLVPLPLRVEYVSAKVRRALLVRRPAHDAQPPADGVRGHLGEMSLLELVQVLRLSRRAATLHIETPAGRGWVVLRDGAIVDAAWGSERGDEAFLELAQPREGFFAVVYSLPAELHRTVFGSTESLLIDAARRSWPDEDDEPKVPGSR